MHMAMSNLAHDPTLFAAILRPHRSLDRNGFFFVMLFIAAISFAVGMAFLLIGAWPVFGLFGLDVLLIYWAFKASYRSARAYEEVTITASAMVVRKVSARGRSQEWTLNPLWVKLDRVTDDEYGLQRLALVSGGRMLTIAGCLGPEEKESFAHALSEALGTAKRSF